MQSEPSESGFIDVGQVCLAIKNIVDLYMPLETFGTLWHIDKDLNAVRPNIQTMDFYIFTSVCLCVCLCVCLSGSACEQNSSRKHTPIWTRFSLNGCLPHWLESSYN